MKINLSIRYFTWILTKNVEMCLLLANMAL